MKIGLREIIFFKLMLGLLAAAYFFGFARMDEKRRAYEDAIAEKQQKLAELARATRDIENMSVKIQSLEQAIDFFEDKLPQEQEVERILGSVTELVSKHGLYSKSFKPNPKPVVTPNYRERQIEITLSGDFFGFYGFVRELELLPRIIKITDLKLRKIDDHDGQTEALVKLSIFFDPPKVVAAAD
ncbi:MAG TPA: type 4a pilus biogenesis protein PilO [Tepidisphaeraceae bacterium]|jgi:Tfp pilus assembly protein PilO